MQEKIIIIIRSIIPTILDPPPERLRAFFPKNWTSYINFKNPRLFLMQFTFNYSDNVNNVFLTFYLLGHLHFIFFLLECSGFLILSRFHSIRIISLGPTFQFSKKICLNRTSFVFSSARWFLGYHALLSILPLSLVTMPRFFLNLFEFFVSLLPSAPALLLRRFRYLGRINETEC